jgi:UDP-N-acetylglucosamine acyltransferase
MSCKVHPTAIIEKGAELGAEVEVGAYSIIGHNVKIGDRTYIAPHVVIEGHTTLGEENTVFQFASLGSAPQDLKYKGEPSELIIGNKNKIREFTTLQPGTSHGRMKTEIGDNNLFMANSHVAHDCQVGSNNILANSVALAGHVYLENGVILGGMAGVHQFCRLGEMSIIGAGSMVRGDIPPYCNGQGDRCHLRGVNVIGLKRAGLDESDINDIRKAYRILFSSAGHINDKIASFPPELKARPLVMKMIAFIEKSEHGVCSPLKYLS